MVFPTASLRPAKGFTIQLRSRRSLAELRAETLPYLEKKAAELKSKGLVKVSLVAKEGLAADEIISIARQTPDNLIAMCTHGRAGVTRWMLGSVTETVVRHSGNPVLVLRAGS